eukprot:Colp12_sorted_trinity150504_noHs@33248
MAEFESRLEKFSVPSWDLHQVVDAKKIQNGAPKRVNFEDPSEHNLLIKPFQSVGKVPSFVAEGSLVHEFFQEPCCAVIYGVAEKVMVAVVDEGHNALLVFDYATKTLILRLGKNEKLDLNKPRCVTFDEQTGNLLIVDTHGHRVRIVGQKGNVLGDLGEGLPADKKLNFPHSVCLDHKNQAVISNSARDRIQVLTLDNLPVSTFGMEGSGVGQFDSPMGIAIGPEGNVYVADMFNHRVQVFSRSFEFVRVIGCEANSADATLDGPVDVDVDEGGLVYVADRGNRRIAVFSQDGKYLMALGCGDLLEPMSVKVGGSVVTVADKGKKAVYFWRKA